MAKGIGYGKTILFGEHFVVYGIPAIAAGVSNKAVIEIKKADEMNYSANVPTVPELTIKAAKAIIAAMKINQNFNIKLTGDLSTSGGLGSSAAFCVALARALNEEYKLGLNDAQINLIAYEGEKTFHGNPSGIDNTMATYGGAMLFTRGKTPQENKFEKIKIGKPLHCVIGVTGVASPTAKMVEKVRKFKDEDPVQFQTLCDEAAEIVRKGRKAVEAGELTPIGQLMNENQQLLKAIGVSIEQNDGIIKAALNAGALGAKVTGGGGGGTCLCLARDEKHAKEIENAIKKTGYVAFYTKIS